MRRGAALVLTAGMVVSTAGAAMAQAGSGPAGGRVRVAVAGERLDQVRARCEAAVDRRLPALDRLKRLVTDAKWLTDQHRSTLTGQIDAEAAGLTALKAKIAGDGDLETLVADCRSIVHDYRVFMAMVPKTRLVMAADRIPAAANKLTELAGRLQTRIDEAEADGKGVGDAQDALDEMKARIEAATDAADGVADKVLPIEPQDYADSRSLIREARKSIGDAREALRAAAQAGRKVVAALKALA
jgi:hypothetical protein